MVIPGEGRRGSLKYAKALRGHAHYSRHVSAVCFNMLLWQQYSLRPSFLPKSGMISESDKTHLRHSCHQSLDQKLPKVRTKPPQYTICERGNQGWT
jgi:hypothetical protein